MWGKIRPSRLLQIIFIPSYLDSTRKSIRFKKKIMSIGTKLTKLWQFQNLAIIRDNWWSYLIILGKPQKLMDCEPFDGQQNRQHHTTTTFLEQQQQQTQRQASFAFQNITRVYFHWSNFNINYYKQKVVGARRFTRDVRTTLSWRHTIKSHTYKITSMTSSWRHRDGI